MTSTEAQDASAEGTSPQAHGAGLPEPSALVSLVLSDGQALLNGQSLGGGMTTPLGEFTRSNSEWGARADGVLIGTSGVLIADVHAGSVHLDAIEHDNSILVGFLLHGALEVSSDSDGTEEVEVGGGFAMRTSTSCTFHWRQPSSAVMVIIPDPEVDGFRERIGDTVVRLDRSNALVPPVTAFLKTVAAAETKPSAQSAKLLEQLVRSKIDAVLLIHLAGTQRERTTQLETR